MTEERLIKIKGEWELIKVIDEEYPEEMPYKLRNTRVSVMESFKTEAEGLKAIKYANRISSSQYFDQ